MTRLWLQGGGRGLPGYRWRGVVRTSPCSAHSPCVIVAKSLTCGSQLPNVEPEGSDAVTVLSVGSVDYWDFVPAILGKSCVSSFVG